MRHKEFLKAYAKKRNIKEGTAQKHLDDMLHILNEEFKKGESVTIQNLGKFYCKEGRYSDTKVFKFTPAAKIKAVLGWSSTYRGEI